MSLFQCDECGCVDESEIAYPMGTEDHGQSRTNWLCTECQTGEWHGMFEKEQYRPEFDIVINRPSGVSV